jgi:hypothetical protein
MYCTYTQYHTVLYRVTTLYSQHFTFIYLILLHVLYFPPYIPSLTYSVTAIKPAHYKPPPSPLCVLLTLYYDDVHSAGGGGRCCSGAGWDTTGRGLGHYSDVIEGKY